MRAVDVRMDRVIWLWAHPRSRSTAVLRMMLERAYRWGGYHWQPYQPPPRRSPPQRGTRSRMR